MKTLKRTFAITIFFLATIAVAQENVFLDRGYWKANPSIEKIETDIATGNDIAALTSSMFDAVCYALMEKTDNAVVKHLLTKKGNEVDKLTHDGRTYIFWAAYKDNLEIMKHLVANGAKANIEDSHGYSVMNFAAVTGQINTELYDFLLENKADINAKNHDGANVLLLVAPFAEDYGLLQYFIDKGVDSKSEDEQGNGLFHYAAKGGHIAVLKDIVAKGIPYKTVNKKGGNAILLASQGTRNSQNSLENYTYLEGLGINPNIVDTDGRNPLHAIASKSDDLSIYKYFIEKGVSVGQQDKDGVSPFMNAAHRNDLGVVKFLSDHVTDINAKDKEGRSAIAMAVDRNNPKVVEFLLEKGADIKSIDKMGNSLAYYLMNSFNAKKPEAFEAKLKLLQAKGLVLTEAQNNGNTLLHLAAQENNLPLLKRLEDFNMDINHRNEEGNTALHLAAMSSDNESILKYLIQKGADKSLKTEFEETVYDLVSENELLKEQLTSLDYLK